ncbi:MAG TPA: MarR family winged helix-turn-helix transcriptional regulator [Acidimicrobiales bacterium]|nr:MarR family winged helix-turn-helix transcriptional regulator [Acidimicrobiales bacterium]
MSGPRLRTVRVDPFATSKIAREHGLSAPQAWVLHVLAIQAGYRSHEWVGTLSVLADDTRLSPRTVAKAVSMLVKKGLLEEREAFRQGNEEGRVFVAVRERIVATSKGSSESHSISTRSGLVSDEVEQIVDNDLGEEGGSKEARQQGGKVGPEGECAVCGQPSAGHPFSDHEPISDALDVEDSPPLSDDDFAAWSSHEATP